MRNLIRVLCAVNCDHLKWRSSKKRKKEKMEKKQSKTEGSNWKKFGGARSEAEGFLGSLLLIDGDLSSIWRHIKFRVAGHPLKGAVASLLLADICCMQARCARLSYAFTRRVSQVGGWGGGGWAVGSGEISPAHTYTHVHAHTLTKRCEEKHRRGFLFST